MKNKGTGNITETELDGLLNEAFLNLDFESNVANKEILSVVSKQVMSAKNGFYFFTSYRFNFLLLIISLFALFTSLYRFVNRFNVDTTAIIQNKKHETFIVTKKFASKTSVKPVNAVKSEVSHFTDKLKKQGKAHKSLKKLPLIVIAKQKNIIDSVLSENKITIQLASSDSLAYLKDLDSLQLLSNIEPIKRIVTAKNKPIKSKTVAQVPVAKKKSRTKKFGVSRLFQKDGTFRMKGGRYGKSKHPYHK